MSMPEVIKRTILQAIKLLDAAGCKYKIIDSYGNEYGVLVVAPTKKPINRKHAYGAMTNYFTPLIKNLAVGEVICISPGEFTAKDLQGAISGWASANWGNGNYRTCVSNNEVQILRCA
jgi:hypothetical protein